ncbi:MAG: hypothetical protein ACLRWQ_24070 [Flavonifractor plautii]
MSPVIGFFGGGLAMIWAGTQRTKKAKRFRKYLALIGRRESISITSPGPGHARLAATPLCDDISGDAGRAVHCQTGYLDMATGRRLILTDEGLQEERPLPPSPTSRSRRSSLPGHGRR